MKRVCETEMDLRGSSGSCAIDWLASRPFADPQRISFCRLSYGGKTAVRVPPLLDGYALSICSADFNEWVWKTTSIDSAYSYMLTPECDMLGIRLCQRCQLFGSCEADGAPGCSW